MRHSSRLPMKNTLKHLTLKDLSDLMVQTVDDLIYMPQKSTISIFREKEKEIELIHAAILTAKRMIKHP